MSFLTVAIASMLVGVAHPADLRTPTTAFTGGPVHVQSCQADSILTYSPVSEGAPTPIGGDSANLEISFVNQATVTATKVNFAIRSLGHTETIIDAGKFSTGATIRHTFWSPSMDPNDVQCTVDSVSFADGSSWTQR